MYDEIKAFCSADFPILSQIRTNGIESAIITVFRKSSENFETSTWNFEKIWKFRKKLKISKKNWKSRKIWKFLKNLKISKKSENFEKIWKFRKKWNFRKKQTEIVEKTEHLEKILIFEKSWNFWQNHKILKKSEKCEKDNNIF